MDKFRINLQLFAYNPQAQPVNNTGSETLTPEMKTFYDMTLIDEAGPNLVHNQFGQTKTIPRGKGKTIEFRKFEALPKALDQLVEGVTPDPTAVTVTSMNATLGQYGQFIPHTDVLELTALDNMIVEDTKLLGRQAGRTLDTITRNIIQSGTNVSYAPKVAADGTETEVTDRADLDGTAQLTVDVINQAVAKLRAQNAPTIDGQNYVAIIHPYAAYDLMRDPAWVDAHKYAEPENIYAGEIGRIGGVRFVQTTEAMIDGPGKIGGVLPSRYVLHTAITSASSAVKPNATILAADATKINNAITGGATYKVYVGGDLAEIASVTAGAPGTATITLKGSVANKAAGTVICGDGAAKNGMAVFCTLFIGKDAYGVVGVDGGNLQTIVKQLGSGGTSDPLNQRSTVGWKAMTTAKILIENYLLRVEHCSARYSATVESN